MTSPPAHDLSADDVVNWDVRTWSTAVRFWDEEIADESSPLNCLEIGAGPGGPSLWLAAKGHRVVCSNRSDTQLLASPLHSQFPQVTTIEYRDVDITDIPWENHFDVIVFKSVVGGIHPVGRTAQEQAMAQIHKALKPGGRLLFAENLKGTVFHQLARYLAYRRRPGPPWKYVSLRDMRELLAPFDSHRLDTTGVLALFGASESQRNALARADESLVNHLVPKPWRYVVFGVATKK